MTRIFVLFNLKPGADKAAYEDWAKSTDLPIVTMQRVAAEFTTFAEPTFLLSRPLHG